MLGQGSNPEGLFLFYIVNILLTGAGGQYIIIITVPTTPLNNAYQGGSFNLLERTMDNEKRERERIKEPKTFQEQVDILKARGLIIEDKDKAREILSQINYYRLSAYTLTYKKDNRFEGGTSFETIYKLYEFDKRLRNMIIGMLETIEVAFRTHIAYLIAHKYGALGYKKKENFIDNQIHEMMMQNLDFEINRSREIFVEHHKYKYDGIF